MHKGSLFTDTDIDYSACDSEDGPEFSGWWFGDSVGGQQVWSRSIEKSESGKVRLSEDCGGNSIGTAFGCKLLAESSVEENHRQSITLEFCTEMDSSAKTLEIALAIKVPPSRGWRVPWDAECVEGLLIAMASKTCITWVGQKISKLPEHDEKHHWCHIICRLRWKSRTPWHSLWATDPHPMHPRRPAKANPKCRKLQLLQLLRHPSSHRSSSNPRFSHRRLISPWC